MIYDFKDKNIQYKNALGIVKMMNSMLDFEHSDNLSKHHFWTIGIGEYMTVQYIELVSLGAKHPFKVNPRKVFRFATQKDVPFIIVVQYEPSIQFKPSREDIMLTEKLVKSGYILGISALDHILMDTKKHYSFAEKVPFVGIEKDEYWDRFNSIQE